MSIARAFLTSIFNRSQNAVSRGEDERIALRLTESSCPEFFSLRSIEDARAFRSELELAERSGAIEIRAKVMVQPPLDVAGVAVLNLAKLANFLGARLRRDSVSEARSMLDTHTGLFPVLTEVIERWSLGHKVRGQEATDASVAQILDAIRLISARRGVVRDELLRRVSAMMFGDSKRVEGIVKWIDLLWFNSIAPSGLDSSEVFSAIGLHKEPLPVLISGPLTVVTSTTTVGVVHPYLGFAPAHIAGFVPNPAVLSWRVLTIENRQTFHEFAEAASDQVGLVLLYTGGMPSPSWRQVYMLILKSLPRQTTQAFHFGDLDEGGMRIGAVIAGSAAEAGFTLKPWLMDPRELIGLGYALKPTAESVSSAMSRTCRSIGWNDLAIHVETHPGTLEQEVLLPQFPGS